MQHVIEKATLQDASSRLFKLTLGLLFPSIVITRLLPLPISVPELLVSMMLTVDWKRRST